jgi:4-nitrophenyl phosphatase
VVSQANLKGKFSGLILDMDGVLYRGSQALPGSRELFPALRATGLSFILLTNNSTLTTQDYSVKLARMGIVVPPEAILTSGSATAVYLQENYPSGGRVYVLGEAGLVDTLTHMPGFRLDAEEPDFVIVGLDFKFDYDSLRRACAALRRGAHFIATNNDATLPVEGGQIWPGAGSLVAALQTCSGVPPTIIGKPNVTMAAMALEELNLPANRVLCVGDRLETDIAMGVAAGMKTALLLTGVSEREDIPKTGIVPDYVFEGIPELMSNLGIF